jgi:hypothetical protein
LTNFSYNGSVQKWVYRDNGSSWKEFKGGTASSYLYDYDSYTDTIINREYRAYLIRSNACAIDTTQSLLVQIRPFSYGNAGAIQPTTSAATLCSGTAAYAYIPSNSNYSVQKWIYKDGLASGWNEFSSNTASTSLYDTKTAVNNNVLRTYRAIIRTNTCSYDTTQSVGILFNARVYGYATATTLTSTIGVYCSSAPVNMNVVSSTMPSGSSVRAWMYMDNMSGQWIVIPNSTSTFLTHTNTSVLVPTTRAYRIVVNNTNSCSYDSSNIFSVSINPSGSGYATTITPTISANSVCNGSGYPTLNVSLPSGFSMLKWVVNNNGTGWGDFGYTATNTSVTDYNIAVQNPVSRSYRAIVTNTSTCSLDSTNTVSASINPAVQGVLNTVVPTSARTQYCYTKQVQVTVVRPTNYSIVYWLYSDNGGAWSIINDDNPTLTDRNTYVSNVTSRSYRAIMFNYSNCQNDTTAALTIILNPRNAGVNPNTTLPTASPAAGICSGNGVTLFASPGAGNELYKWTYSDNGVSGPWFDVLGSYNQSSFTHQLTQIEVATPRLYRAIVTDTSTCDFDSTQAVLVNIKPITYGTDTTISITGADSVCVGTNVSLSVAPGSGNSVTKWIYRDNGGIWKDFSSSTQSNFLNDANTSLTPGTNRGYSPMILKSSLCRIDTLSKVKMVTFKQKTYGTGTVFTNITSDTVCAGNTLSVTTSGSVEKWLFRDGKLGSWSEVVGTSTFLSHSATGVLTSGWRYYKALLNTGSCNADSTAADSVYLKVQSRGNIAVAPSATTTTVCAGNSVTLNLSLSNAVMQMWLFRDNGVGNWNILSNATSFVVTDYNTYVSAPVSREYRAIVLRTCSYDTTSALTIAITPKGKGTDITKVPTVLSSTVCASSPVQNIQVNPGSGNTIVKWLTRDNGGAWQVFASGNQNVLTDYNTYVGNVVIRDYAAIIDNNTSCSFDTSAKLTVTINPVVLGNSTRNVTTTAVACMNNSYTVSLSVASDTTVIRFLSSYNGGAWSDEGYISPSTNATISRYAYNGSPYTIGYRAITYKTSNCHIDTSAATVVSVIPRTYGNDNTILPTGATSVCSGSSANISVSAGSGNTVSQWLYSDDGTNWLPYYSSSTSISVSSVTNNLINRQYRALIVKANACTIDTTAAKTLVINPIVYGTDTLSQINISTGTAACNGATITIATNPSPNSISKWLYRDNAASWTPMYQTGTTINDLNTFVSSTVNRIYSAIIWKQATCKLDTILKTDTIAITPRTYGNDTNIIITPSASFICIGNSVSLTANVGIHSVQTWYYRDNGGVWNVLSSSPSSSIVDYNTGVSVVTVREYRALIKKSNACALDTTNAVTVNINPRNVGSDNTIVPTVSNATMCSGSSIAVSVVPGFGNSVQKWIYSINGGSWMDYAYTSATSVNDYNTTVSATTIKMYRAIILKGSGCAVDTSAAVTVTISPIGFGNQQAVIPVATKSAICSGSNVSISVNGFTGSSVLRWLYRDDVLAGWNVLYSSATTITDFNTQTPSTFTREYRAVINNTISGCSTDTTASASVVVSPITNGTIATPVVASQSTICSGNPINVLINPGTGKVVSSWLYQDPGSDWTLFASTSATSVNDFNTTVTANTSRSYRAIVSNNAGCSLDSSALVTVAIHLITNGTNLTITPNTSTPNLCSGNTAVVSVSGFSGTIVKWLYRDSVTDSWSSILSTNFTLFHNSTFVLYPRTRVYRAIVYDAGNCSYDTTASIQLQINPQLAGNANSIVPTTAGTTACTGSTVTISASGFINGGSVTGWVFSDDGGVWTKITSLSGATINHLIAVTGPTTRQYRALVLTGCNTDTTAALSLLLDKLPTKPVISNPAGTDSLVCSEVATSYEWRLNGTIIPGAISKVHVATVKGTYTVQVANSANCKALSENYTHSMVGLEKVFANTKVQLYPNPTLSGKVTLACEGLAVDRVKLVVMDLLGKVVVEEEIKIDSNTLIDIDLAKENAGIYFVTLSSNGDSITRKISFVK